MPTASAPAQPSADTVTRDALLAPFRMAPARKRTYVADAKAKRASVPAVSDVAYVTRGIHANTEAPVLMLVDGSATVAIALSAIGCAIAGKVVSAAEIQALIG